jgi:hypothetical protein
MNTTTAPYNLAFALVRDAAKLMDAVDPGTTTLPDHEYGPVAIRTRRFYRPQQDTLTLIAYHGEQLAATVIATNNGQRVTARVHEMRAAGILFRRHGDWGFIGTGRVDGVRRRFELTATRDHRWRVDVNGEDPTTWPTVTAAVEHITATYAPAG